MSVTLYKVGGFVRDSLLGVKSKDIDFAVEAPSFAAMEAYILENGGKIFLSKPEFQTIRAKLKGVDADFVLCRKDGVYTDGRRPDSVEPGTIYDDLARRDFTMNAIAMYEDGSLFDPFGGVTDLKRGIIRCVGKAADRFAEDSLRMLRAVRFAITKGMKIDDDIWECLDDTHFLDMLQNVSEERIREELLRCFKHDTLKTLLTLEWHSALRRVIFTRTQIWLQPTMKDK